MADLPLLAARLFNRPHYVEPAYAEAVAVALAHRMGNPVIVKASKDGDGEPVVQRPARSPMLTKAGVMVLPIVGGLYHRGDSLDAMSGSQSYTNLNNMLLTALDNKDVKGILLDIDSPGGQAAGCFEFADTIRTAAKQKPIRAIANASAFSAAYAIGCSADRLYVTPSGEVGSIGVMLMHRDVSKMMADAGVKVTMIFAGKHKADGNPFEPLPSEVRDTIQAEINLAYEDFIEMVAARRPMSVKQVRDTQARTYRAADAVEMKLADEVASFSQALAAFEADLSPKIYQSTNGVTVMSATNEPAAQGGTMKIAGLDEALARARSDGEAAATAAMSEKLVEAYKKGRNDSAEIIGGEAGEGRTATAVKLARNHKLSVEEAVDMLAAVPKEDGGKAFQAQLRAADPKVPAGEQNASGVVTEEPVRQFQQSVNNHVRSILGIN